MSELDLKTLRELGTLDCGDNSCRFATVKGGMRTNGGCRCFKYGPAPGVIPRLALAWRSIHPLLDLIEKLQNKIIEDEEK